MHPGLIGAAVLCFALTIAFAGGVFAKSSDITRLRDGDPDRPNADTVTKLLDQRTQLRSDIAAHERDVLLREKELERADIDLGRHLVYWKEQELLGGISTPGNETATIRGKTVPLKEHRLAMARFALEESGRRLEALKVEYQSDERQKFPALDKAIASRNAELQAVNQRITEQDALFQKDRAALTEALDAKKAEIEKFGKEQATERSRRLTRITQLEDRIRQLLELDLKWLKEIETVGTILSVEDRSNRVIIDMGTSERAFPGLLFEVFTFEKGTYVEKGMLEVIEAKAGISVCRILSQKDRRLHPMAKDDRIGNPTFNPRRPKTFVVAGDFERYNKADLESFIKRSGGLVVQKVGPGVDYLVVRGDDEDHSGRERAQAREYQILAMTEKQLLKYVLPSFSPK